MSLGGQVEGDDSDEEVENVLRIFPETFASEASASPGWSKV